MSPLISLSSTGISRIADHAGGAGDRGLAQAGGALLLTEVEDRNNKVMVFTGIEWARFRRPVSPGDQLRIEVQVKGWRAMPRMIAAKMQGTAFVAGKRVAEATVSCR